MANIDAFSAQIIKLVREMPDEAILDLVKHQLGALGVVGGSKAIGRHRGRGGRAAEGAATRGKRATTGVKRRAGRPRRAAVLSEERKALLDRIEQVVKSGAGMSASDVAKAAAVPQTRAAAALKELKLQKRIFQGGDRRFARYAGDLKTAEHASTTARKTATGPTPSNAKKPSSGGPSSARAPLSRKRSQGPQSSK